MRSGTGSVWVARRIAGEEVMPECRAGWGLRVQQRRGVVRVSVWPQQSAQCIVVVDGCSAMEQGVLRRRTAIRQPKEAKRRRMERAGFAGNAMG